LDKLINAGSADRPFDELKTAKHERKENKRPILIHEGTISPFP